MNESKRASDRDQDKIQGLDNKRLCRVSVNITNEYDQKLTRLSIACGRMSKSKLANELLKIALDSPNVVQHLQELHGSAYKEFWVNPTVIQQGAKKSVVY